MSNPQSEAEVPQWDVADRMGKALRASGVTPKQMANYLHVHRNTITNYTSGKSKPLRSTLIAWADITRCSLDWLETGQGSVNSPPDGRPLRAVASPDNDRYPVAA